MASCSWQRGQYQPQETPVGVSAGQGAVWAAPGPPPAVGGSPARAPLGLQASTLFPPILAREDVPRGPVHPPFSHPSATVPQSAWGLAVGVGDLGSEPDATVVRVGLERLGVEGSGQRGRAVSGGPGCMELERYNRGFEGWIGVF